MLNFLGMLKIYDHRKKRLLEFKALKDGEISMYVCGPTVYDKAHLGHGRSAVAFDVIRRYLEYRFPDRKVKFVSNYTDIDDKMINRAREEGISVSELAARIIPEYEKDYASLGVKNPTVQPRATEQLYIDEMIKLVENLEDGGFAYLIEGDGVYFDVSKYPDYGKFSGQNLDDLQAGARVEVDNRKRNPYDFALWKFRKEGEDDFWETPRWGQGRPGWHIECSAMSKVVLGEKFDIHGGGLDLKFPHHECEVAQSKCAFGSDSFAKYWIHNGFIQINNEKMSKSLGNFTYLQDIFEAYDPQVVRMMFLQTHYRNPINFSQELLEQAKAGLVRIHNFIDRLQREHDDLPEQGEHESVINVNDSLKDFVEGMDNDFNTSNAVALVFDLISEFNIYLDEGKASRVDLDDLLEFFKKIDAVLGVIFPTSDEKIPGEILELSENRQLARAAKDYAASDKLRDEIANRGYVVEDTPSGPVIKKM